MKYYWYILLISLALLTAFVILPVKVLKTTINMKSMIKSHEVFILGIKMRDIKRTDDNNLSYLSKFSSVGGEKNAVLAIRRKTIWASDDQMFSVQNANNHEYNDRNATLLTEAMIKYNEEKYDEVKKLLGAIE